MHLFPYWSFVLYERPILGDHPKAHSEKHCGFHENCCFSWKPQHFSWKVAVFTRKPYKSTNSRQILQFHCVLGGGYVWWFHENHCLFMKTANFHEKQQFSLKSGSFHWKVAVFTRKPYKSTNSRQILQFHCVLGGGYVWWFHENRTKDHQLPGMVTLCLISYYLMYCIHV